MNLCFFMSFYLIGNSIFMVRSKKHKIITVTQTYILWPLVAQFIEQTTVKNIGLT